jgi:hypothetical protein
VRIQKSPDKEDFGKKGLFIKDSNKKYPMGTIYKKRCVNNDLMAHRFAFRGYLKSKKPANPLWNFEC